MKGLTFLKNQQPTIQEKLSDKAKPGFDKEKRKRIGILLIVAGGTALLLTLLFIFFGAKLLLAPGYQFEDDQTLPTVEQLDEAGKITIPGFESMTVKANETKVKTHLYNPESNDCYFEISIRLKNSGSEIYKSKLIKPGQNLYDIELNRGISKGTYDAVLHYSTYTTDGNYSPLNGANIPFELVVE